SAPVREPAAPKRPLPTPLSARIGSHGRVQLSRRLILGGAAFLTTGVIALVGAHWVPRSAPPAPPVRGEIAPAVPPPPARPSAPSQPGAASAPPPTLHEPNWAASSPAAPAQPPPRPAPPAAAPGPPAAAPAAPAAPAAAPPPPPAPAAPSAPLQLPYSGYIAS